VVALTPVAGLMFRFNNPDALVVLLITAATYATLRAIENGRTRWLVLAGALIGGGFLAKELQAFIIIPVLAGVYLLAGRPSLGRRIAQVLAAAVAVIVSSGWWIAAVELIPSASRPYIGGSQNNDLISLIFGYNGFGRLTGNESGSVGGGQGATGRWGPTGLTRMFDTQFGGQISWLIPAAIILLVAGLWFTVHARRTSIARASYLMWGGSLLVTGAVFSFAQGIIHPYYSIALAPATGALVGAGSVELWRRRGDLLARLFLAGAVAASAAWAYVLLDRSPDWNPGLKIAIPVAGLAVSALIVAGPLLQRRLAASVAALALVAAFAGPTAYTLDTVSTSHSGAIPSAGPSVATTGFGPGAANAGRLGPTQGGGGFTPSQGRLGGVGGGNFLQASQVSGELAALLETNASNYRWVVATIDANSAAGYELATGEPVMAIGGFNGSDPAPTLAQFQDYVSKGRVHYFIAGGMRGSGGGSSSQIASWVSANFAAMTVGGVTVYDLTQPLP